ncbi:unnamed protein product [Vitrella brassicaformis CCMP3155]|uniref:peptidylprolyl isomerase n=2 Tax=Vitrella brassicaformis TaxID=1169539 RepID=A0A0G4G5L7_VITBC|nr:unnamed protein product [Vitrella brassicaformis CCMP3155]|eukprot:CEM23842.1 unnamed protein product [Vitrella brassicaformis CCMP3155]
MSLPHDETEQPQDHPSSHTNENAPIPPAAAERNGDVEDYEDGDDDESDDYPGSDGDDDEDDTLNPLAVKQAGNDAFKRGEYKAAVDLWKLALKEILKAGVAASRLDQEQAGGGGGGSFEEQLTLRLNMAQGYLKLDEPDNTVTQCEFVLNHRPDNVKALYRLALAYHHMQDWDKSLSTVDRLLSVDPENAAAKQLRATVKADKRRAAQQTSKLYAGMMRSALEEGCFETGQESTPEAAVASSSYAEEDKYIFFDPDDLSSQLWRQCHTVDALKKDRRPLLLSYPLTVLNALNQLHPPPVNELAKPRVVMHVVGVAGDYEAEAQWSAILTRVPSLKELIVVLVGFLGEGDRWGKELTYGMLGPPLPKTLESGQTLECRHFRGLYHEFTQVYGDDVAEGGGLCADLCLLSNPSIDRSLDTWLPTLTHLLKNNKLCIVTGYSRMADFTDDAVWLPTIMEELGALIKLPLMWNAFPIRVELAPLPNAPTPAQEPDKDSGERDTDEEEEEENDYTKGAGKNAVIMMFQGLVDGEAEMPPLHEVAERLRAKGVEVHSSQEGGDQQVTHSSTSETGPQGGEQ